MCTYNLIFQFICIRLLSTNHTLCVFILDKACRQKSFKQLSKLTVHEKGVWAKEIKNQHPRIVVS